MKGECLKFFIQCKFHDRPVGKTPVQEIYTGCNYFGNDGYPVVITNNRMSSETRAYAKQLGVEAITEYEGSVKKIVSLVKNGSFLVRIKI